MKLTTLQSVLGQVWAISGSMRVRFSSLSRLDAGGRRVTLLEACEKMEADVIP